MDKRNYLARYIAVGAVAVLFSLVFLGRLINIEVTGQNNYTDTAHNNHKTRVETLQTIRGEIYDRNGKPLVTNEYSYDVYMEYGAFSSCSDEVKNSILLGVLSDAEECAEYDKFEMPSLPFKAEESESGEAKYSYSAEYMDTVYGRRLEKILLEITEREELPSADDAVKILCARYGMSDEEGNFLYSEEARAKELFALRLDMELHNFSYKEPYTVLKGVTMVLMTRLEEDAFRGVKINTEIERVYNYPGYASHILGRTGKIQASKAEYYEELGYPMNAVVGTSGAEEAFEEYLHGTDGEVTVVEDEFGNVVDKYVSKEPIPGKNVYLTLDIELQKVAEDALKANIQMIVDKAIEGGKPLMGEDANAGALTLISVDTGEVLALASYPTYNLATFDEDYKKLSTDELSPMFNRALEGTYAPGSTFKPGVAAAALEEGIITPYTELMCDGQYTYYAKNDSEHIPACWIWNMYRGRHGALNVTSAIQVSCNCFFYETGRLLTIQKMNRYCKGYGLGQSTGIELNEKKGVLAGPEYREENGLEAWTPGQTITAAIGQSDNLFTPLQLGVYVSTLINHGTRYKAHILREVREFYTDSVVYSAEPEVMPDSVPLSDSTVSVVMDGMKNVIDNGSAAGVFRGYPITIGGKTGTAQVRDDKSENAVFTAFAPFSDPEVAAVCVIEQGSTGSDAGYAVRDVFNKYFGFEATSPEDGDEE